MANFYEHYYQGPYDFNQVNSFYDHNNHYHQYQQQQEIAFDPTSYNDYYNYNGSESDETSSYYNWNGSEYDNDTRSSASIAAYSVSTMSEPKHLFYDPSYYYTTTYESPPQFSIYCSVAQGFNELEFNEPEFDDYDPTPYGGGYDIVATYGKPLPQSVVTCYPSLTAAQAKPPSPPEIITPVPLGIYDGGEKNVVKKRVTFSVPLESKPLEPIKEQEQEQDEDESEEEEEDESEDEEGEGEEDLGLSNGNGEADNVVEKVEVKALYVPSGYGLEATDLCEVIFGGYFPCVLRNKRLQEEEDRVVSCWESNDSDPWKTTSDYIFGDSYPYGNENRIERNQFEISSYGYRS
ncbi:hypothetical protein AALP_AA1G124000 [Arabis alpina]|uniref:Uncharacterized protein n=1 Tax=Arabis alpina TaxID=50452 RepID=A0A087HMS2_ARAAL|nr:hypothetical protein AALP_AA1G124000 [Arabis alpina]